MSVDAVLWQTIDGKRWFLIPAEHEMRGGTIELRNFQGGLANGDEQWLVKLEIGQAEAYELARVELARTLDELRLGIDDGLADLRHRLDEAKRTPVADHTGITPNAVPALFAMLKSLPRVIIDSLSGDAARIGDASVTMAGLRQRLSEAGINVDESVSNFPDRLAGLREDFGNRTATKNGPSRPPGQSAADHSPHDEAGPPATRTGQ